MGGQCHCYYPRLDNGESIWQGWTLHCHFVRRCSVLQCILMQISAPLVTNHKSCQSIINVLNILTAILTLFIFLHLMLNVTSARNSSVAEANASDVQQRTAVIYRCRRAWLTFLQAMQYNLRDCISRLLGHTHTHQKLLRCSCGKTQPCSCLAVFFSISVQCPALYVHNK